ncbi:diguanylate cyclase [Rubrobacter marinus]|uniref:Diguanylate cyclase n=1 Tax=Rubrobacter marinus TaxID=2653852 RepID=A0A6G8PYX8_9ACTN|nr:diguanylate cyclase [Rubrobacter marinus]QIN79380.1 diguanylate cyclase [Rubrobacter marinus]
MAEAPRESQERFESAFEYAAIGMGLVAPDGRWLRVNRALCETLGYPEEELLGKTFQDITHPDDLDADLEQVGRLLSGESRTYRKEKRYFRKDGRTVWALLSVSAVHDEAGEVLYLISQVQDVTERKVLEEKLSHLAYHDALTGLPNRTLLEERIGHAFDRSGRTRAPVALLYLDLDGFKEVNDSLGHEAGDRLLTALARRIETRSRPADTVARLGGDEFCVLLEDIRGPGEAARIAGRLREYLAEPFDLPEGQVRVGVSIGVAEKGPNDDGRTAGRLLCEADAEMYRTKKAAKARPREFSLAADSPARGSNHARPERARPLL